MFVEENGSRFWQPPLLAEILVCSSTCPDPLLGSGNLNLSQSWLPVGCGDMFQQVATVGSHVAPVVEYRACPSSCDKLVLRVQAWKISPSAKVCSLGSNSWLARFISVLSSGSLVFAMFWGCFLSSWSSGAEFPQLEPLPVISLWINHHPLWLVRWWLPCSP